MCLSVYCYATELHAFDFLIKDFVVKRDIICAGSFIWRNSNVKFNDTEVMIDLFIYAVGTQGKK